MQESTGKIDFFPNGEVPQDHLAVSDREMALFEVNKEKTMACIEAWNKFIATRPKTPTIEKIKMRQAFVEGYMTAFQKGTP